MIDATPLLKLYAARRVRTLQSENVTSSQRYQLLTLVRHAAHTKFGRDHNFAAIRDVADFQAAVPLRRYETMWRDYWQPSFPVLENCSWPGRIPFFALSSGTSAGASKYIPCTNKMNRANRRAALDLLVHHVANWPASHVMGGKIFMLGGSTELTQLADGVCSGDLSGIAALRTPLSGAQLHLSTAGTRHDFRLGEKSCGIEFGGVASGHSRHLRNAKLVADIFSTPVRAAARFTIAVDFLFSKT